MMHAATPALILTLINIVTYAGMLLIVQSTGSRQCLFRRWWLILTCDPAFGFVFELCRHAANRVLNAHVLR
jgi:hypothetical protein